MKRNGHINKGADYVKGVTSIVEDTFADKASAIYTMQSIGFKVIDTDHEGFSGLTTMARFDGDHDTALVYPEPEDGAKYRVVTMYRAGPPPKSF